MCYYLQNGLDKLLAIGSVQLNNGVIICQKGHRDWISLQSLPRDKGGHGRRRCAGCVYEQGLIGSESILELNSLD